MTVEPLINFSGEPFDVEMITSLTESLASFSNDDRIKFRNTNATKIVDDGSPKMLIVSGPGTGKSTMFIRRILRWHNAYSNHQIVVVTFVRKLVEDLNKTIGLSEELPPEDKQCITVSTLHKLARSIVEQYNGTQEFRLKPWCRIISGDYWESLVWKDAVSCHSNYSAEDYSWSTMRDYLYDGKNQEEPDWGTLRTQHLVLQQFYNALTFADLILVADKVAQENPKFVSNSLFIIDEFQDFNLADAAFIATLASKSPSLLLVGDDDQVLYDKLRRSHADIIRDYYKNTDYVNAILPYCSRCSFHICQTAAHFIRVNRSEISIPKIFLSLAKTDNSSKVKVVAATSPKLGVSYIKNFLDEHNEQIRARQNELDSKSASDPYLLILTPSRKMNFLKPNGALERLNKMLSNYSSLTVKPGVDYWKLRDYFYVADHPSQNYSVRKLLAHENIGHDKITSLIKQALGEKKDFQDLNNDLVKDLIKKAKDIKTIIISTVEIATKIEELQSLIEIVDSDALLRDLQKAPISSTVDPDDESVEFEQTDIVSAVQIVTIVGAKGLSADHVILLGCDDCNLQYTTPNAFFVALTRARKSLTLLACIGGGGASKLHDFVCSFPNDHTEAIYVKANGQRRFETIGELQAQLETWAYAKQVNRTKHS